MSPWRVRERVWRELGQIRLLHLLEHEDLILSMISLLHCPQATVKASASASASASAGVRGGGSTRVAGRESRDGSSKTMLLVSKAILEALSCLRAAEDKDWMIVSVGLYHIAASIFSTDSHSDTPSMTSPQLRALTNMVSDCSTADWVVCGVLQAADRFFGCDASADRTVHGESGEGEKKGEGEGVEGCGRAMQGTDQILGLTCFRERFTHYHQERVRDSTPLSELALMHMHLPMLPVSAVSLPAIVSAAAVAVGGGQNEVVGDGAEHQERDAGTALKVLILHHRPHLL